MYIFVKDTHRDFTLAFAYKRVLVGPAILFFLRETKIKKKKNLNYCLNPAFLILPIGTKSPNWIFDVVRT